MPNGEEKKENKLEGFEIAEQSKSLKDERKRNENKASKILIRKFDRRLIDKFRESIWRRLFAKSSRHLDRIDQIDPQIRLI